MSKYDFDEDDNQENDLNDIARKLTQARTSKDALVKLLKQAGRALEKSQQSTEDASIAPESLAKALANKAVMDHKDKDVRVCAAHCLCHILRIYAPESPYTTAQLQDIFGLFMWVFRKLENPTSPAFQLTLSVLDIVSQVKCCVMMLDFDNDEMVCDLFKVLLGTINASNRESAGTAMLELMASMIEEADDVSQQLLDTILEHVVAPKKTEEPEAYRLAQQLMHRAEDRLQIYLQRLLSSIILSNNVDSELVEDFPSLVHEIHLACPQTLLPVLPLLAQELQAEEEARRLGAIDLLGKLFKLPDSDMDQEYSFLFEEFIRRSKDQKAEVRLQVLQAAKQMLGNCSAASTAKVLQAVVARVQDFEEKVRSKAIGAICEAATAHPEAVTLDALEAVSGRLRDKKVAVRKEAAHQLASVFRAYCTRSHNSAVISSDEERVIWIPARLLVAASRDTEVYSFILDTVFRQGLFSSKLPVEAAARQWGVVFMSCPEQDQSAVMAVLRAKARAQQDVQAFLTIRADKSPGGSPFSGSSTAKLDQAMRRVTASFPDFARANEALQKINELRDNHIFRGLATLCTPGTTLETAAKTSKDVVQRIGSKGFVGEFAKCLCARLSPNLLAPEHLEALMKLVIEEKGSKADSAFLPAVVQLLVAVAAAAPPLFANWGSQVTKLLTHKDTTLGTAAAQILTHAASYMSHDATAAVDDEEEAADESMSFSDQLKPLLLQLCSSGSPHAAKASIRALSKVLDSEYVLRTFEALAKKLVAVLQKPAACSSPALPAALEALGTLGQVAPAVFATHATSVADFVLDELLETPLDDCLSGTADMMLKGPLQSKAGGEAHQGIILKLLGIKALARACVTNAAEQPDETKQVASRLVDQLLFLVNPENELAHLDVPSPIDEGCVRLGAANALLKLARGHDSPITADVYLQLALTMQDPIMEVRQQFARKVHQMVQDMQKDMSAGSRAAKWAAMLPLAAMDPTEANCKAAFGYLMEYVVIRRHAVQHRLAAAANSQSSEGTILHEYPDFILPFVIQSLAHHPDFPAAEDVAEDVSVLEPFQKMLQFALEPLLSMSTAIVQAGSTLPIVQKILRSLKHTEDATAESASTNVYILCDMALAVASAVVKSQQSSKAKGKQPSSASTAVPGNVPLPASFYRSLDMRTSERKSDGSHLPEGFEVKLADLMPKQQSPADKPKKESKAKGQGKSPTQEPGSAKGKGKGQQAGRKRKSDGSRDSDSKTRSKRRQKAKSGAEYEGASEEEEDQSDEEAKSEAEESSEEEQDQSDADAISEAEAEDMQTSSPQSSGRKQPGRRARGAQKSPTLPSSPSAQPNSTLKKLQSTSPSPRKRKVPERSKGKQLPVDPMQTDALQAGKLAAEESDEEPGAVASAEEDDAKQDDGMLPLLSARAGRVRARRQSIEKAAAGSVQSDDAEEDELPSSKKAKRSPTAAGNAARKPNATRAKATAKLSKSANTAEPDSDDADSEGHNANADKPAAASAKQQGSATQKGAEKRSKAGKAAAEAASEGSDADAVLGIASASTSNSKGARSKRQVPAAKQRRTAKAPVAPESESEGAECKADAADKQGTAKAKQAAAGTQRPKAATAKSLAADESDAETAETDSQPLPVKLKPVAPKAGNAKPAASKSAKPAAKPRSAAAAAAQPEAAGATMLGGDASEQQADAKPAAVSKAAKGKAVKRGTAKVAAAKSQDKQEQEPAEDSETKARGRSREGAAKENKQANPAAVQSSTVPASKSKKAAAGSLAANKVQKSKAEESKVNKAAAGASSNGKKPQAAAKGKASRHQGGGKASVKHDEYALSDSEGASSAEEATKHTSPRKATR